MAVTESKSMFPVALQEQPHAFLQPNLPLHTNTLAYLKHLLDPLATDISNTQQERQSDERKKRKRGERLTENEVLRLKQVHTEGFGVEQIWEQVRRVIEGARGEIERDLEQVAVGEAQGEDGSDSDNGDSGEMDLDADELDDEVSDDLGEEGLDYEIEGIDDDEDAEPDSEGEDDFDEMEDGLHDDEDIEMSDKTDERVTRKGEAAEELKEDKFGLNDGFFSIDDFNRNSEFLEQQDFRGDDDGAASDEEDVDWDSNPLAAGAVARPDAGADAAESESEDEDDGPTFGDPDAPSEDEDEDLDAGEMDAMGGMSNTNNVMYSDFFAPPAQKKQKNKKGRPNPHNFPEKPSSAKHAEQGPGQEEMERALADVNRDLFDDEESNPSDEEEEDAQDAPEPSDPRSRRSTHERRKAALTEEIRKLEAANVAKREWTLAGEARAAERPVNSLLEEDLDFERAGKPVPVITAEVSESIEELIKRRILAHDFQDLQRRRPDDLATGSKRGRLDFELDSEKSKKGLAEEYEEEHLRRNDPNFVDAKDEKTKKEEQEIANLWREVCSSLDSLSSWHFRPKPAAPNVEIRVDAPAVTMEDARPSAGGEVAGGSALAPQEIYKGGEATKGEKGEVVGKSGLPQGREEMGREEKKSRRRRAKERAGKREPASAKAGSESRGAKEREMLGDLKKGGVKIVGNKGDVRDVEGKEVRKGAGDEVQGAGRYKL